MGLFYAYLKSDQGDYTRYLITFASRETADEWWRLISTSTSPYSGTIQRISPQFYAGNLGVTSFFSQEQLPEARQFYRKMFMTEISHVHGINPTAIPPTEVTDHISGRWYFIRSKADPLSHWYFRTDGACLICGDAHCEAIHVSTGHRTKFCVRTRNPAGRDIQVPEDFVMIGADEISIAAPKDYTVHINDAGDLKATKGYRGGMDIVFKDLKDMFITRAEKQVNGEIWEYVVPVEKGLGETWELVD